MKESKRATHKKVLITGSTGAVGREVLTQLQTANLLNRVTVLARDTRNNRRILKPYAREIDIVFGDICNKDKVIEACKGKDVVIHMAAIIPPLSDENLERKHAVNFGGTKNVVDAMEANSPEAFLLYTSSISIYGDRVKNPVIQVSDPLPEKEHDPYTITKVEAEKYIRNSAIDWSIFRLTAIMGVGNHKMTGLMFDMPLETPLEIATVRDTARAIVHAIDKTHLLRQQIFNLGGGEKCRISYLKFLTKAFEAFGLGKVNFPDYAFAKQNFHCGYYGDGDDLEEILHFRQDDIESYFERFSASVPFIQRIFTMPFAAIVKYVLLRFSKPFKAYKKRDVERIKFYFGGNDI